MRVPWGRKRKGLLNKVSEQFLYILSFSITWVICDLGIPTFQPVEHQLSNNLTCSACTIVDAI
jgi:hypothetical protein